MASLEAKKVKADAKAAEEAKKSEAEAVVKKLLAGGMEVLTKFSEKAEVKIYACNCKSAFLL